MQKAPIGVVDAVTVNGATVSVAGWAFDPNTVSPIGVRVYLDGTAVANGTANVSRPDVAAAYGNGALHGYNVAFAATAGPHKVCVRGLDSSTAAETELDCRAFTGAAPAPVNAAPTGVIDAISVSGTTATVSGWAFDPDTTAPIGVHFYIDGGWAGATTADISRPDVGRSTARATCTATPSPSRRRRASTPVRVRHRRERRPQPGVRVPGLHRRVIPVGYEVGASTTGAASSQPLRPVADRLDARGDQRVVAQDRVRRTRRGSDERIARRGRDRRRVQPGGAHAAAANPCHDVRPDEVAVVDARRRAATTSRCTRSARSAVHVG